MTTSSSISVGTLSNDMLSSCVDVLLPTVEGEEEVGQGAEARNARALMIPNLERLECSLDPLPRTSPRSGTTTINVSSFCTSKLQSQTTIGQIKFSDCLHC
jgi:hypothetical protein